MDLVCESIPRQIDCDFSVPKGCKQQQLDNGTLEFTHRGADVFGDEAQNIVRDCELKMLLLSFLT